jgi:CNT family concentrative nucleoside transporter
MERFTGLIGIVLIFSIAYFMSNNRKAINYRLVISGLGLQLMLALVFKTTWGQICFQYVGQKIQTMLALADQGGAFVFGFLVDKAFLAEKFGPEHQFIFVFKVMPAIIFVAVLVKMFYHLGIMQRVVGVLARVVHVLMQVSGAEALSNVASAFVGQVEAQIMIEPYLNTMTNSELLASMTGSMACIAGGVMAVYISMGVPAPYLLAASMMAAPASLVISKIVFPETEISPTKGVVKLEIKRTHINLLDAISDGAGEGMKVAVNVVAMLIGFIALIGLADLILGKLGAGLAATGLNLSMLGIDLHTLNLNQIFGSIFSVFSRAMGVPKADSFTVGSLLGTKMVVNEFVAYTRMSDLIKSGALSPKSIAIASYACCGFANFSSIAIQVGGIGKLATARRGDLARLGFRALVCGTLASYLNATIAGILF